MQILTRPALTWTLHAKQKRDLPARTPHPSLTRSLNISKTPGTHPNEVSSNSSEHKQPWIFFPGSTEDIHGTVATKTEEVKILDMTLDASLPPSAPVTIPATLEDSRDPHMNGHEPNGSGEVHADRMSQHQTPTASLQQTCADIYGRVSRFLAVQTQDESMQRTQEQSRIALEVIEEALQRYEFDTLSLSYNGGKDCLVLLILYLAALHKHFSRESSDQSKKFPICIPSIYAKPPDPFPQVSSFVETSTAAYHLSLTHISTNPGPNPKNKSHTSPPLVHGQTSEAKPIVTFRDAFALYLDANPKIQAIFVGTRRTDPHGAKLTHFDMTDGNWPRFMRIHPVIDWQLSDVWTFLRHSTLADPVTGQMLEYCSIYDMGYTSLGGVGDTLRNPKLRYHDEKGHEKYRPAYEMTEDRGERLGRE